MTKNSLVSANHLQGKLLIAHPRLSRSDWFHKTVVYLYEHSHIFGASGLVLNIPSKLSVADLCQEHDIEYPWANEKIYAGGPVTPGNVIMLHTGEWHSSNTGLVSTDYSITSDYNMFGKIAQGDQPYYWRMFAGVAAWAPGQLEQELEGEPPSRREHSWLLADPNDDIIFQTDGDNQWQAALDLSAKQLFDAWI